MPTVRRNLSRARQAWQSTHPWVRRGSYVSEALGLIAVTVGVAFELRGDSVSRDYPFITNLWSSLAVSLIGAPVAAVLIAEFTNRGAAYRDRLELLQQLQSLGAQINSSVEACARNGRDTTDLRRMVGRLTERASTDQNGGALTSDAHEDWVSEFGAAESVNESLMRVRRLWNRLLTLESSVVRNDWEWIHEDVENCFPRHLDEALSGLNEMTGGEFSLANVKRVSQAILQMRQEAHSLSCNFNFGPGFD